jgi:hypothetical protein
MSDSTYLCPSCGEPLEQAIVLINETETVYKNVIWCGDGRCASTACNDGGTGATLAEAMKALETAWEDEAEQRPY